MKLEKAQYCTKCGGSVSSSWQNSDNRERQVCGSCGQIHYQNPLILVSCIVLWQRRLLLCRRAQDPAAGQWVLPSGYLECGETLQEGAARETLEETGVQIQPDALELSSVMNLPEIDEILITFRTELSSEPALNPGAESLEVRFLPEEEIEMKEFAWRRFLGDGPRIFFKELQTRNFSIKLINVAPSNSKMPYQAREYFIKSHDPPA